MSTQRALAELRRKKQCIERAIRALEELRSLEQSADADDAAQPKSRTGTSNLVEIPRNETRR